MKYCLGHVFMKSVYAVVGAAIFSSAAFAEQIQDQRQRTTLLNSYSEVISASSPDNSFDVLSSIIDGARKSIKLSAYKLPSIYVTDRLENAAKRGVKIRILLDGWTVGKPRDQKVDTQDLHNAERLVKAGAKVIYLASDRGQRDDRRFKFLHSKYLVIDDEVLYVSSENFGDSAFPITRTVGNRGWSVAIKNKDLAQMYAKVFEADNAKVPGFKDLIRYGAAPSYTLQDRKYVPVRKREEGKYLPVRARLIKEKMSFERVLSPDDATAMNRAIIGSIKKAKETLVIQNLSFSPHWGPEDDTPEMNPSLIAEAVLSAARRGVSVRVMVNPVFFLQKPDQKRQKWQQMAELFNTFNIDSIFPQASSRDNQALIEYFRQVAANESLDLQANMFWVEEDGLRLLHNKGMIVDRKKTLVSSINWGENSMKNNREVGVLITSKKVADYYQSLFEHDWKYSRNTQ